LEKSGSSALRIAEGFTPEIAFLDIGLPVMDGYELAGHLTKLSGLRGIQLVAVTGYGQESDRQKSRAAGFQHHLVKPVDSDALDSVVNGTGAPSPKRTVP
jgi:CheY-like chemotaxis protein